MSKCTFSTSPSIKDIYLFIYKRNINFYKHFSSYAIHFSSYAIYSLQIRKENIYILSLVF